MTNTIDIDLAEVLESKLQFGFSIPVPIDVSQLLEYADDDWRHELDLDGLLAEQRKAAVVFSADEIRKEYPHLTDEQAWEAAQVLRDQFQYGVMDFVDNLIWMTYPSEVMKLTQRVQNLRSALGQRTDERSAAVRAELAGLQRLLGKVKDDPALCGVVAATLDDIEASLAQQGGAV